jgi:hypothetical protein
LRIFLWDWFPFFLGVEGAGESRRGLGGLEEAGESVIGDSGEPNGEGVAWPALDSESTSAAGSKS